jgi:hypothetical protein
MQGASIFRRLLATATLTAIAALIVGGVTVARAGDSKSAKGKTFVLHERQTNFTFVEVNGRPGGGPGDEFIIHTGLFGSSGKVGTLDIVCIFVLGNKTQCRGTNTLPGGTIVVSALVPVTNRLITVHASIDGGTGRYDEVRGQVTSVQDTATTTTDTFDID